MDVKTRGLPPSPDERAAVATVLGPEPASGLHDRIGGHANRARRHLLLPTLHAVNDRLGWISPTAVDHIAERLDLGPAEVYGVASFYALFSTTERPVHQVHVCVDIACRAWGRTEADLADEEHPSPCLGVCERGEAVLTIDAGDPVRRAVTPEPPPSAAVPEAGDPSLVLLGRVGRTTPTSLADYVADDGFQALALARRIGPEAVIARVGAAGLTGRGGAAFPTATKWEAVRNQPGPVHHLVANADESEPGTFKDRTLIENDPYALIEAMAVAGLAVGADDGHVYLRGEYPRAEATLRHAITEARSAGHIGPGTGFDITVVRGAGAYICGEETAVFNSIEGYRGEPRNKPPFPFERGLFGRPTAVNNVETLLNVPPILLGRLPVADRRLFCLSGAVARPGVYETELGGTLGELIDRAGGLRSGSELQAVLLGGAAGGFAGPGELDLVLDPDTLRAAGLTLGSGVVLVLDQHVDLVDQLSRIAAFFADESCGQCVPCRIGTVRQREAVDRLAGNGTAPGRAVELELMRDMGRAMTDASICGLGQTAHSAIASAIDRLGVWS
ncbi:MAG: NADH-ubiquinone oxidoreductase-F iron-sulfur binding region domain-containing protein [Acidimicrobiales bacterium]